MRKEGKDKVVVLKKKTLTFKFRGDNCRNIRELTEN